MKTLADHARAYRERRNAKLARYKEALNWIAKFGRDNPGHGYSCATKAIEALSGDKL